MSHPKQRLYNQRAYAKHRDKILERNKRWPAENPDRKRAHARKYALNHKEDNNRRTQLARLAVVKFFGGRCVKCGFDDARALQLDHINGRNGQKRTAVNGYSQLKLTRVNPDYMRSTFQLLCANCNTIKRIENKEFRNAYKRIYDTSQISLVTVDIAKQ